MTARYVVCAAIRNAASEIITGPRHYDGVMRAQIAARTDADTWTHPVTQGFVDQYGQFWTREEAWIIAEHAGQIRHPDVGGGAKGVLYSEHLY